MRKFWRLAICSLAISYLATDAFGFGTLNSLGQNAEHERITRAALNEFGARTLDELAGETGTFGAVGAPDNPARGLMFSSEAHCDNGDYLPLGATYPQSEAEAEATLQRCRNWIVGRLEEAVRVAEPLSRPGRFNTSLDCVFNGAPGRAKCMVLENLGLAFHASQDFYAHSNWVDRAAEAPLGLENPPGLGNTTRAPWLDPDEEASFPEGLMSGCFVAIPESLFCEGRVRHAALSKDLGPIGPNGAAGSGTTPRAAINENFQRAVAAAIDDTRDKWAYFQERVLATYGEADGARIICVIRNDNYRRC